MNTKNAFNGKRLLDVRELCTYCSIGTCTAREWGRDIGAERRIGRRVLYDRVAVDAAIDRLGSGEEFDALHLLEDTGRPESRGE